LEYKEAGVNAMISWNPETETHELRAAQLLESNL
jgi:hypothetical protein